jgi:hypothetical protein
MQPRAAFDAAALDILGLVEGPVMKLQNEAVPEAILGDLETDGNRPEEVADFLCRAFSSI